MSCRRHQVQADGPDGQPHGMNYQVVIMKASNQEIQVCMLPLMLSSRANKQFATLLAARCGLGFSSSST